MIQHVSETLSVPIAIDLNLLVKGDSSKQKKKKLPIKSGSTHETFLLRHGLFHNLR